jgi:RhtB (resistance to homoserine/threonine) family protein
MNLFLSLTALLGAIAVGAISPGPSFLFVVRTSVAGSRREGLAAALGMGLGAVVFAGLVMLGLQAVLVRVTWLFFTLQAAGALYLVYLGVGIWRGAARPMAVDGPGVVVSGSTAQAFRRALLTQLSNPKALVVYGSIFAALLPANLPAAAALALPLLVFAVEAGWYAIVAVALSAPAPRKKYLHCKTAIDRIAGGVLGLLGAKLLWSAATNR